MACGGGIGLPIPFAFGTRNKTGDAGFIQSSSGKCPAPDIVPVDEANWTDINRMEIVALAQISFKM